MSDLRTLMATDAADGGTFFPTSSGSPVGFNETVTFYPQYDSANAQTVNAMVIRDRLEGTREVRGDGNVFNRDDGRSVRRSVTIICAASLNVRQKQPLRDPDAFVDSDGVTWIVKRIEAQDEYLQDVLCVHRDDSTVRSDARSG